MKDSWEDMTEEEVKLYAKGISQALNNILWSKVVGSAQIEQSFDLSANIESKVNVKITMEDIKEVIEYCNGEVT